MSISAPIRGRTPQPRDGPVPWQKFVVGVRHWMFGDPARIMVDSASSQTVTNRALAAGRMRRPHPCSAFQCDPGRQGVDVSLAPA